MTIKRRELILQVIQTGSVLAIAGASEQVFGLSSDAWKPSFFDPEQNDTIVALGERIIPGSTEALCNRVIDSVLAIDSKRNKAQMLEAIGAFNNEAQKRYGQAFRGLSLQQQDEILSAASQPEAALQDRFALVKEWMADAYWSSAQGLRELGSTGRMAWETFPGCQRV